jgi:hypothetical protein
MNPPKFVSRRKPEGSWYIEVTWPNGKKERNGDFHSSVEADAEGKIRLESWLEGNQHYDRPLYARRHKVSAG